MPTELLRVRTADGILLEGCMNSPEPMSQQGRSAVDAWLLVHGTGGSFYAPSVLEAFANHLLQQGQAALRVNSAATPSAFGSRS